MLESPKLTARQQQILDLIQTAISRTGAPPTRAEIATELGFKSANAAEEHLQALARKGVIELVGGTRAESCLANKTEKALGLLVVSSAPESEEVGGSRSTMVGGAILETIGGSSTVTATGKAVFVGAFHKVDASGSIVFKCGDSEVVIDGGGVAIKAALVTITAPKVTLTKDVAES